MRQIKGLSLAVVAIASSALAAAPAPAPKAAPAAKPAPAPAPVVAPPPPAPTPAPAPVVAPAPTATPVTVRPERTEVLAENTEALETEYASTASYSARSGAALGKGSAIRAQISAGTFNSINTAQVNLEAGFLMSVARSVDFGVNLRVPLNVGGLSPGATVRWNFANDGKLHFAVVGNLNIPFSFANNATVGLGVEPGIVASYELTERAEIFTGALVSYNQQIWSRTASQSATYAGFTGTLRGGLAYAIMSKAGIFVNVDLFAGYEPVRRKIVIGDQTTGLALGAALTAGFQMAL